MQTEDQIRKTEYAKALIRIKELETDLDKLAKDNNRQQDLILHHEKRIEDLEDKILNLEDENKEMRAELDSGVVVPCTSLTEQMAIEETFSI